MAVQMAAPSAQDMLSVQGSSSESAHHHGTAIRDKGDSAQSFEKTLSATRKTKNDALTKNPKNFSEKTASEQEQAANATVAFMSGRENIRAFSTLMESSMENGDIDLAIANMKESAEAPSRFDPDAILGLDFLGGLQGEGKEEEGQINDSDESDLIETTPVCDMLDVLDVAEALPKAPSVENGMPGDVASLELQPSMPHQTEESASVETSADEQVVFSADKGLLADAGRMNDAPKSMLRDVDANDIEKNAAEGENPHLMATEKGAHQEKDVFKALLNTEAKQTSPSETMGTEEADDGVSLKEETAAKHEVPKDFMRTPSKETSETSPKSEAVFEKDARDIDIPEEALTVEEAGSEEETARPEERKAETPLFERARSAGSESGSDRNTGEDAKNFANKENKEDTPLKKAPKATADTTADKNTGAKEGVSDASKQSTSFANEFSNAAKGRAAEANDQPQASSETSRSGNTYVLNGERAFSDGVNTVIEFMRSDGTTEARIVVEPPALGRIDVSLQSTASGVEATFKVDNEQLKQMMQQQLDVLKNSLQAQGIQVSGLAVDIRNRDDQRNRGDATETGAGKKSRRLGGIGGASDEPEGETKSLVRLDLEKGLLHWVA